MIIRRSSSNVTLSLVVNRLYSKQESVSDNGSTATFPVTETE